MMTNQTYAELAGAKPYQFKAWMKVMDYKPHQAASALGLRLRQAQYLASGTILPTPTMRRLMAALAAGHSPLDVWPEG